MSLALDHLAVACTDLDAGAAHVARTLGVEMAEGGRHADFGTHNRLLGLGPGEYMEAIAIDPAAPPPGRPRWFGLDRFEGPPRLRSWVVRTDDLDAALARMPEAGVPLSLARGAYRWRMAVPPDGQLPWDGLFPALMQWEGPQHPAQALPPTGCRLLALEIAHPDAPALAARLGLQDPRIAFRAGSPGLTATIETPRGTVRLA